MPEILERLEHLKKINQNNLKKDKSEITVLGMDDYITWLESQEGSN